MPMSEAQKQANLAARKVRDAAYHARFRAYRKEVDATEQDPRVVQALAKAKAADAAWQASIDRIEARERELRAQIEALEQEIHSLRATPSHVEAQRKERAQGYNVWREELALLQQAIDARYPDLEGPARYSAAAWQPPAEVLQAMEEARRNPASVLAKPAKKRATKP